MQVIEQNFSFCVHNLNMTRDIFKGRFSTDISRLVVGNYYSYTTVIEIIFNSLEKIIPFEISNMIGDSWIAIDSAENVIYNIT